MVVDVGELYGSLNERLQRIVSKQIHAPAVVIEDACQFAWYRLVYHAARIDQEMVTAWPVRVAIHEAVKLARREQRELSLEAKLEEAGELNVPSLAPGPHERTGRREKLGWR